MKINRTSPDEHEYLQGLAAIAKPPKSLYFIGTIPPSRRPTVAIVGTRRPTAYGKQVAASISTALAQKGIVIVSGLALGIDAIAQAAALQAGGTTIGVLASGVDQITPRTNSQLGQKIAQQGGAIISEYPPGTTPYASNFLARNRIEAAISDTIIVVEAARRSGTLNTAAHALEQGKNVYAVPGNITSPLSAGCNYLIAQGAMPLLNPQQIFNDFGIRDSPQAELLGDNAQETKILALLQNGIIDGEQLQASCKMPAQDLNATLTIMEIKGLVRNLGANQWARA